MRQLLEHLLEWNLIYRDQKDMMRLAPVPEAAQVVTEPTGVNVFLEIRKPKHAAATAARQ